MKLEEEAYRGYVAHMEYGNVVWYRTTASSTISVSPKTGKEQRAGTRMVRVCTTATTFEEAKKQLDRYLTKPEKESQFKVPKNQTNLFG